MNMKKFVGVLALSVLLGACAAPSHPPIAMKSEALGGSDNRIAVQMNEIPETDTSFPGAGCLLCIGAARAAHSDLSTQVQSLEPEGLEALPARLAEILRTKGAVVSMVDEKIDPRELDEFSGYVTGRETPEKDFRPLARSLNADKLLIVDITGQGVRRPYYLYAPTGIPRAHVQGAAYMVDLKTNAYDWYWPIDIEVMAEGEWKEPPAFPGLTNAYFQAVEQALNQTLGSLNGSAPVAGQSAAQTASK